MSDTPTPPWGIRVEHDGRNEYADGIERLQTRLLHIGLFLVTVVILGGGAGVLMVVTEGARAATVSVAVVAGCVVAVLVAVVAAMSATRQLTPLARRPRPAPFVAPQPRPAPEPIEVVTRQPEPAPLWARSGEQQVTITDDPGQRREVFVKLARRLQSLINRAIKRIDELEQDNEDPELLDGLYEIDHLFTLARRQGENLAVLGGEAPQRRSNKPVSVYAVLLAAVSEAEHYRQIAIVPVEDVEIHGHAVAEIIHLLAELLENATRFTSPDGPKVEVRAVKVTAGLAIEVQDRGLGMSYEDLERINHLLDGSTRIDLSELLSDGRIGLAVVRELARRHDIKVRLQSNIFGGIAAAVVIPPQLLSEPERESRHRTQQRQQRPSALPRRRAEPTALDAAAPQPGASNAMEAETGANQASRHAQEAVATRSAAQAFTPEPATSLATAEPHTGRPTPSPNPRTSTATITPEPGGTRRATVATAAEQSGPIHMSSSSPRASAATTVSEPGASRRTTTATAQTPTTAEQSGPIHMPSSSPHTAATTTPEPSASRRATLATAQPSTAAEQSGPIQVPSPAPIPLAEPGVSRPGPFRGAEPTVVPAVEQTAQQPAIRSSTSDYVPSVAEQSGPIRVPSPMPIPTASVPSVGSGFGPTQPTQSGRRRRAEEPEDELPVLPVRAPGRSYDDLRAGGDGVVTAEDEDDQPPPLPQRRGSHLREELLEPPAVTKPVPGHNTSLMKSFQAGRDSWQAEQDRDANTNRGDSWPTT